MTHSGRFHLFVAAILAAVLLGGFAENASAQQKKPNIVIIWGDDIGQSNISAYSMGLMGYRTPNIDRVAQRRDDLYRLLRRAELHGRPSFVPHRPAWPADRAHQGRTARRDAGFAEGRSDHCRVAQAARLRDRPVRQEPSWATATSSCRRSTDSTSSTATCIT